MTEYSRSEFWALALKAAGVLQRAGLEAGDCHAHYFSGNTVEDLAFRLGSVISGTTPVTINWQADTPERVLQKLRLTKSKLLIIDDETPTDVVEMLKAELSVPVFRAADLAEQADDCVVSPAAELSSPRIVIFTSGTTGEPKGVELSYEAYRCNRETFEDFLEAKGQLTCVVVNPMHHTNSTSITDWCLRKPQARLHLVQRYSTQYWGVLATAGTGLPLGAEGLPAAIDARNASGVLVAPLVSRHIDFLESLAASSALPLPEDLLRRALSGTTLLLGSAPVGPTTVERLQRFANRLPTVRFGSTETCLQVLGTPVFRSEAERLEMFQRGWAHSWQDQPASGYYIGRAHEPHTEVRVVRSVKPGCLEDCAEGEPGQMITRGQNLMRGYVGNPEATAKVFVDGWYVNLGDITFWLSGPDGAKEYFWMSRDSALLIRGGANYSYEQINAELKAFIATHYSLQPDHVEVAVVGLNLRSEHEDDCLVTIELAPEAAPKQAEIEESFLKAAAKQVSKGAKPDRVRFAELPRNFKGAVLLPDLKEIWRGLAK